ncbi:MAG: polysaccharide deacetylase family protein [Ruminococcus sp.]|nr:polysaccharide deacetylase family protein [Ruminococcus sp.]MCM1478745.1 polysaccharide deacetylase family protein [Muribaculaceae bacterium]
MSTEKIIALTFDDGPSGVTSQILDVVEKHAVPASFFVCGNNVTPERFGTMRRAVTLGCEIHNHSRTHSDMTGMSPEEIRAEIDFTSDMVEKAVGVPPRFFRPPYIAVNEKMHEAIDLTFICGLGAEDWLDEVSAEERYNRIISQAEDGLIILLHDAEGNVKTVRAVDMIIPELKRQGYEFVTVSRLFERKKITPKRGEMYTFVR